MRMEETVTVQKFVGNKGGSLRMSAMQIRSQIAPEALRLMLLAFGIQHSYRVIQFEEIHQSFPHIHKETIREGLQRLASEGLLTKFTGRYCFNKLIPAEIRRRIEQRISPSGTVKVTGVGSRE